MELRNPLTKFRADSLYRPLDDVLRRDLRDNDTEYLVVGDISTDRQIRIEYSFELPLSKRAQVGNIVLVKDSEGIDMDHQYSFPGSELSSVDFFTDVLSNDIRLVIVTSGLGENPTIKYRLTSIGVA